MVQEISPPPVNLPHGGGRFPRKFSPHPRRDPRIRNHRTVLREEIENLPPDREYWYFLRKKIIGGFKFLGKLPPRGVKVPRKTSPTGGGADLPGGGVFS